MGFFDWGRKLVNGLPVVGGITSNLWGDPSQEGVQDAYGKAQQQQAQQRAYMMDGRMNAMNQAAMAFGPRNQMLGQMMGQQGPAMDMTPMLQNPMSMAQQNDIRSAAFGPGAPSAAPPGAGGQPQAVGGAFTGTGPQNPYRRG